MGNLRFQVKEIHQNASGGSWVVGYSAEIELSNFPNQIAMEVLSTIPSDARTSSAEIFDAVANSTREGFIEALYPASLGAYIRLSDLIIHPVDSNPIKQKQISKLFLSKALPKSGN